MLQMNTAMTECWVTSADYVTVASDVHTSDVDAPVPLYVDTSINTVHYQLTRVNYAVVISYRRLFQSFGPAEANERSPTVTRRDGRTTR